MANKVFSKSVFANYFDADNAEALAWAENVLVKLKESGLVPEYIQREDEDLGDTDFEDYYRPIAIFFAYLVKLARTFEDFKDNGFLAGEYLNQHGQFTSGNESLDQLAYAIENALRIRAQRGGTKMIEESVSLVEPDGELLRLIGWDGEFFKLGIASPERNGWTIDNCSPLYRGNTGRYDLNVGYEYTEDVLSLAPYPLINPYSISIATYRGKQCIEIEYGGLEESGIGANEPIGSDEEDKRIRVDPRINFEITFYVAQDATYENITFSVLAFDIDGNAVNLKSVVNGTDRNFFFETRRLNKAGHFYFVRGILFNQNKLLVSEENAKLNIGFGQNLIMPENVAYIIPKIVIDNNLSDDIDSGGDSIDGSDSFSDSYDGEQSVYLWNLKVTSASTEYSRCYLDNKNFIDIYCDNISRKYSNEEIEVFLRKYFIPLDTAFNTIFLEESFEVESNFVLLEEGDYFLLEDENRTLLE